MKSPQLTIATQNDQFLFYRILTGVPRSAWPSFLRRFFPRPCSPADGSQDQSAFRDATHAWRAESRSQQAAQAGLHAQLRRCLEHDSLTADSWAQVIESLLPKGKWVLSMDRTEWKRGDTTINLLVLAVVVHGSAVPLLWTVLPFCGASTSTLLRESDTAERIALLGRFMTLFTREKLRFLTADREFIGAEWIAWLLATKLPFRIRIKANTTLTHEDRAEQSAAKWFEKRSCRCKSRAMELWGLLVFVGGRRLKTKDRKGNVQYLIVISNEKGGDLWEDYRLRWNIETLFQALKGRGFDLESCRLSREKRLSGWFGFLALGLCWCLKVGRCLDETEPLPLKKHGRRSVSIFQRGLNELRRLIACLAGRPNDECFRRVLQELCLG